MTREYKFKAWLKKEKKMVDVLSIEFDAKIIAFYKQDEEYEDIIRQTFAPFEDIELIQYTCINDKDGVEIYEGYIVEYEGDLLIVRFDVEDGRYELTNYVYYELLEKYQSKYYKVVGNIYENPELLGGKYETN